MNFTEDIYIYDLGETDFNHNGFPISDFWEEPEINRKINGRYALTGMYLKEGQLSELIVKDAVVRALVPDGSWQKFRISSIEDDGDFINFTARFKGLDANRNFIDYMHVANGSVSEIMQRIEESLEFNQEYEFKSDMTKRHQFTIKQNNPIDAIMGKNNDNQNLLSVTSGELDMYDNTFHLKERLGRDQGFRIDFGINLEAIKETISDEEPPNTLYLIGAMPDGDYDEEREPITLKYVEAPGVVITPENRVVGKFTNENCKTQQELREWAINELFGVQKIHLPKTSHEISLVDLANTLEYQDFAEYVDLQLGDTIYGTLQDSNREVVERVVEYTYYPRLREHKKLGTGSDVEYYTEKSESKLETINRKVEKKAVVLQKNIVNATELITGNDKGNIMFWPKNRPRELRIMDTEDAGTAKEVWRFNLAGLGHSSNGVNGPFDVAITQDGAIVADFITAGILRGILVMGNLIKTIGASGAYQAVMHEGQFMIEEYVETTDVDYSKENWQDDVRGKRVGGIVGTYSNGKANGSAILNYPGYIFSINQNGGDGTSNPIFQVPKESTKEDRLYNLFGKGTFKGEVEFEEPIEVNKLATFKSTANFEKVVAFLENVAVLGRLDVKELYVDGVKIDKNGGGSSGGGGDAGGDLSIFVRVLALTAKYEMGDRSSGYYHEPLNDGAGWNYGKYSFTQAYEMDNFLSWLAQNYPETRNALQGAVGSTTFNNSWEAYGNANDELFTGLQAEYFCRKKLKPMIDYLKSNTGVDFNDGSKWLGTLSLLSSITNWYPAAVQGGFFYSFVQQYAGNWNDGSFISSVCDYIVANAESMVPAEYAQGIRNRFTNEKQDALQLTAATKIPFDAAASGWQMPIAKPVTVTSEFGQRTSPLPPYNEELHNGIDLVNNNPTTPICASQAGEVVVSTHEASYGNYVVILHSGGIYTGYAHMSERIVSVGDTVNRGQQIGNMGSTGDSTAAHLHFQFFRNGPWPQDWPNDFINPRDMMQF